MTDDKPWQLKRLPTLINPTSVKPVGVRLYKSADEWLRSTNIKISGFIREAVRSVLNEIRSKGK